MVYLSEGCLGNVPGKIPNSCPGGMEAETKQMFEKYHAAALKPHAALASNSDLQVPRDAHADMGSDKGAFSKVYVPYFPPDRMPTRIRLQRVQPSPLAPGWRWNAGLTQNKALN